MKKSFVGIASVLSLLALSACSDDSSSPKTTDPITDPSNPVVDPSNPVVDPSNPVVDPSNPVVDPSSSSSELVNPPDPNENIADQPITEDDKKDDGTASVNSLSVNVSGVAELGPFAAGAEVSFSSMDAKTMAATPAFKTTVSDKLGSYTATGALTSAIAGITVSGPYYDFANGSADLMPALNAIVDLRERKKANVNVLTHLEKSRVEYLVASQGMSFTAAKERAQKEVLVALGFKTDDSTKFEDISLYDMTDAGENLLSISAALLHGRKIAETENILNTAALDISADGRWDDDASKALVGDAAYEMLSDDGGTNLSDYNNYADVRTYNSGKRRLWAAMYNLGSCTDLNENEVKVNGNPLSANGSMMFACVEGDWTKASAAHVSNYQVAMIFGACNASLNGVVKENAGMSYICKNNLWNEATADDLAAAAVAATAGACSSTNEYAVVTTGGASYICLSGAWTKTIGTPVDYTKGRAMNARLGAGINFGNSWEAPSNDDSGWSNPINDGDFSTAKQAGFNSVRIPVRWYTGMSNKLSGVKADVQTAINAGLVVIINYHHYEPMIEAAKAGGSSFNSKLTEFANEWKQIAQTFDSFSDEKLMFEIFNEPYDISQDAVNKIMTTGYEAIRSVSKGKTIMFESNGYSKFAQIPKLNLPADGNIIVSGHYYEPFNFTHQGHGYDCNANANDGISSMAKQFKSYADSIAVHFPDATKGSVPMNMGEFGVANHGSCSAVSDSKREKWTNAALEQATKYGMSWHYWCFKNCGGFEAGNGSSWYGNIMSVFKKYM